MSEGAPMALDVTTKQTQLSQNLLRPVTTMDERTKQMQGYEGNDLHI